MLRGIYTSATGMVAEMDRQNVIANNLANVDTVGFKRDNCTTVPFAELLLNAYSKHAPYAIGKLGLGVQAVTQVVDFSVGPVVDTGNMTDFAIEGDGLFAVQTANGIRYSRAGNFQLNKDNYLVTKEGYQVLGENGPVKVEIGDNGKSDFTVTEEGQIMRGDEVLDQLQIFSTKGMRKEGEYFYNNQGAQRAAGYRIHQRALEHSNVNPVREMIQMINTSRSYDASQKALTAHDDTLNKLVNDLAR